MYAPSTFVYAAIVALARVAVATPPACLIAAIGAQANPADLTSLCGTLEPQVAGNITSLCSGDNEASAISVYSASCLAAGVTVSVETASSSGSATTTGTGTAKITGSSTSTATGSGSKASGTATATGTSASSTAIESSSSGANTLPQSVMIMGTLVLGFGFASYLL